MGASPRRCAIVLPCVPEHGLDSLLPLAALAVASYTARMGLSVLTFDCIWKFEKQGYIKKVMRCISP